MRAGPAVEVLGLCKRFQRREWRSLKEVLLRRGSSVGPLEVLRDVSFTVEPGEWISLIGPNGSGKSTLFRLMSGIYPPDAGTLRINGRVAPLIELLAGFHPDLTGMENLHLNAAILGLSRKETEERSARIVEYAQLAEFMDTPVRYYSSGMMSRLGFAITVHVDADVLLVDEVLAVGDEEFQHRCLRTLHELRDAGRTIILVTHDLVAAERETTRTVWLEQGRVVRDGPSSEVIAAYRERHGAHPAPAS